MPFPLYEGAPLYDKLVADMKKLIQRAIKAGAETFYNGGAYGFDIVAGETTVSYTHLASFSWISAPIWLAVSSKLPASSKTVSLSRIIFHPPYNPNS